MKILVAYYSRTGTTKKVAAALAARLGADFEEIRDTVDRAGVKGYLVSGRDAALKRLTQLVPAAKDPKEYDLTVIGTPIWGWNVSVPVRTYVTEHRNGFKQVAFFCTMGGSGDKRAFAEMAGIIGREPLDTLALTTQEVVKDGFKENLEKFLPKLG